MATTEGWVSSWSASLNGFKKAGTLVIDAKYGLALVGDVYTEFFLYFLPLDVLTGILWQLFRPFFRGLLRIPLVY